MKSLMFLTLENHRTQSTRIKVFQTLKVRIKVSQMQQVCSKSTKLTSVKLEEPNEHEAAFKV